MFMVEIDKTRNLLHFTVAQTFGEEDGRHCLAAVKLCMHDLKKGFVILTDLRELKSMEPSSRPYVQDIMKTCNENKVSKIVRITPARSEDFGLKVMSVFHYDSAIPIIVCTSFEEAWKHLPAPNISH